jgi:flavin-binding protein dodecin
MAVVKVIEVLAQSPDGWEAAAQEALREAAKSVHDIQQVYVREFQAIVENDEITNYRLNAKISFVVRDELSDDR